MGAGSYIFFSELRIGGGGGLLVIFLSTLSLDDGELLAILQGELILFDTCLDSSNNLNS